MYGSGSHSDLECWYPLCIVLLHPLTKLITSCYTMVWRRYWDWDIGLWKDGVLLSCFVSKFWVAKERRGPVMLYQPTEWLYPTEVNFGTRKVQDLYVNLPAGNPNMAMEGDEVIRGKDISSASQHPRSAPASEACDKHMAYVLRENWLSVILFACWLLLDNRQRILSWYCAPHLYSWFSLLRETEWVRNFGEERWTN